VIDCHSKLGQQTARIDQLQREVELHKKGEQSLSKAVGELKAKLEETPSKISEIKTVTFIKQDSPVVESVIVPDLEPITPHLIKIDISPKPLATKGLSRDIDLDDLI
jgi:hypothetical protein